MNKCDFCNSIVSSKYVLKNHLVTNKKCLSIRNIEPSKSFRCKSCDYTATDNQKLIIHKENCKTYQIELIKKKYEEDLQKKDLLIIELQNNKDLNIKYTKLEVKYEELEKQHEKTINKLEMKISQCDDFIKTLAREGSNKITTTHNTVNNTVRNQLSSTFTLDNLEHKKLEETIREHYTERDFFGGQKRLANFFFERVIKTLDDKMLICCTDTSRKKFKILDVRGNLKEDIEARSLCEKLKVPTQMVTKEIYEKVIVKIESEKERLSTDDRSRREKLLDDTMRAQLIYMDIFNFDDINYNQDFMHELCILLNV